MGASPKNASASKSPKQPNNTPPRQDPSAKTDTAGKPRGSSNAEATKPLAPPPRPGQQQQQQSTNTPDYFAAQVGGSLSLEPNPFEQSFGGGGPETPGGTKLPSVAALTSPSSLLPGANATPFNWGGGSLRTGPLSPAMLSGPANDYFGDTHHLRGGFPTPNESSLRSGLTPGGSGSMFPAPSPNSQALFAQLANGGATPSTLDFHRTALSAATKREHSSGGLQQGQQQQAVTSQPHEMPDAASTAKPEAKQAHGPFDPHDNDAANGLFMLAQGAQGRNENQNTNQFVAPSAPGHAHPAPAPPRNQDTSSQISSGNAGSIDSGRGGSDASMMSDDGAQARLTRGRGKKNSLTTTGRRKADDTTTKAPPNKKAKGRAINDSIELSDYEDEDGDDVMKHEDGSKSKMNDEEKRKNFLERNRVAALKCRQRKKQWLANLQAKVDMFSTENDALTTQITQLREEVVNLKTLLLAHKDCPVTQQQGLHGGYLPQVVEPFNAQMNPYGMAAPMTNQQVMAGQGVQRRFS
ncbi:Transcription factor atf1 [Tolypocladium capitatum]|uniref:Transcription factor atf1 n=1 Tax=Tolypocladium capitatum TaxID=45235 RepID=A0A2K3QQP8_9HYPO|nr:Transcription factor atf1 [Tolypocladium capitatum]